MVAQLAGNLHGYRLRQGVAGTSLLPGDAVYTMPETLSLSLCNTFVPGAIRASRSPSKRSEPGMPRHQKIAFGPKHDSMRLGLYF